MLGILLKRADEVANVPMRWVVSRDRVPPSPVQTDIVLDPHGWDTPQVQGEGLEQQGGIESIPDEVRCWFGYSGHSSMQNLYYGEFNTREPSLCQLSLPGNSEIHSNKFSIS